MKKVLDITKALADRNRLRIIFMLSEYEELCVCQITEVLNIAMPSVSRHMSILMNARLVKSRKDSRWVYYRISGDFPLALLKWLKEILNESQEIEEDCKHLEKTLSEKTMEFCKDRSNKRRKCNV
jgi:ArsR family transcriptional regulator, arsenate/arsenite/antimonite-responsive transcriptional repressor